MLFSFFFHFVYISKTIFCPRYITSKQQTQEASTAGATVLSLSLAASRAASYVRMRTTAKHQAAGTVKRTVPYKDFCIFFINWGMATDIKLKDYILYIYNYKERIKEKRTHYIKCYR
jgi:hypothetical protein